jgi:hypothetical protein
MPGVEAIAIPPDDALAFDDPGEVRASGVNARSGQYLAPLLAASELSAIAEGRELSKAELLEIRRREQAGKESFGFAPQPKLDLNDLAAVGWGIVFAADEPDPDQWLTALEPLWKLRAGQAGPLYKVYRGDDGLRRDESGWQFLGRHGSGFGPIDPRHGVPAYLLFVGDAARLPFEQQCEIDVKHAVGRLDLERLDDVAAYAERVKLAEREPWAPAASRAVFWGTRNAGDLATQRSARHLIAPLARQFAQECPDWRVDGLVAAAATKAALREALHAEQPPALLMTASHGAGYPSGDTDQREWQGALVSQEWGGPLLPGQLSRDMLFGAADLDPAARLDGLIAFLFACYGAGTPETDHFLPEEVTGTARIAPAAFTARLAQRMLAQGATAVIGHVERAWTHSFLTPLAGAQQTVFASLFSSLVGGDRLGAAMETFNDRYSQLAAHLHSERTRPKNTSGRDENIAFLWTASTDARNYVIIGDPAARLGSGRQGPS